LSAVSRLGAYLGDVPSAAYADLPLSHILPTTARGSALSNPPPTVPSLYIFAFALSLHPSLVQAFFNLLSAHLLCLYILRFALATLPTRRGLSYPVLAVISIILTPAHIVDIVFLSPPCHPHRHLLGRSFLAHFYSGETRPSASAGNDVASRPRRRR